MLFILEEIVIEMVAEYHQISVAIILDHLDKLGKYLKKQDKYSIILVQRVCLQ